MTEIRKGSSQGLDDRQLLVAPLDHFGRMDLDQVGGKAANLGELVRAGFPVPPGFVLTTTAYEQFVSDYGLAETITQALHDQPGNGARIRAAFESTPIPTGIEREIMKAYQALGEGAVAVRSSATAEDLPGAAFAGQQDTYLNVIGPVALLDAVRRCWASLWTDRAISYRERLGLEQQTVKLAVVCQNMVAADVAGVMFTANPVTGAQDEVVVDANPGLGEAIVSGLVTPDHFRLQRRWWGWRIVERSLGHHEVIIRPRSDGGTEQVHQISTASVPTLPDRTLSHLAQTGKAIQHHFGVPQDIEWAWADGKLFILQARPITALPTPPPQANRLQVLVANNFIEMFPVRPYPLDLDTWILGLGSALEPIFRMVGLDWKIGRLFETQDGVVIHYCEELPRLTWKIFLAPFRLISRILRYDPIHWQSDPLLIEMVTRAHELESRELDTLSWVQLLEVLSKAKEITLLAAGEIRCRYFPRAAAAAAQMRILLGLLGQAGTFGVLLSSAETKTTEMNRALEELADQVRSNPALAHIFSASSPETLWGALEDQLAGRAFLDQLQSFFYRYGHRETVISSSLQPTWKEAPAVVLGIIKTFASQAPQPQSGKPAWQSAYDSVSQHPLMRFAPFRSGLERIFARARLLLQIREDTHFYATMVLPVYRRTILEMGRRLTSLGVLDVKEDIYHLSIKELERVPDQDHLAPDLAVELRASVLRRKTARLNLENTPVIDPRLFPQSKIEGGAILRGTAGSPGTAEGPARIVHDFTEFDRLAVGDVLVAPFTNPSWTPLFQRAAAVIVDSGSAASHAAIVAREYGIPAVMATGTGTQILRDGEIIRVDGSQGIVFRVNDDHAVQKGQGFIGRNSGEKGEINQDARTNTQ